MISRTRLAIALVIAIGCDGSPDRDNDVNRRERSPDATPAEDAASAGAPATDAGDADSGTVASVPEPGDQPSYSWTDNEPNDTPTTAVPSGLLSSSLWIGVGTPVTTINDDTDTDFFVFKTGDADSLAVLFSICWSTTPAPINLLDMFLYVVEGGQVGALVKASTSRDTSCETLLTATEAEIALMADTTYLLEVRAAPGLRRGAHAGNYGARWLPCTT